jgi:hypothetical protein
VFRPIDDPWPIGRTRGALLARLALQHLTTVLAVQAHAEESRALPDIAGVDNRAAGTADGWRVEGGRGHHQRRIQAISIRDVEAIPVADP